MVPDQSRVAHPSVPAEPPFLREIGERIHLSPNTVKTQAQAVYRKLDASSRAEAVEKARDAGLLGEDPRRDAETASPTHVIMRNEGCIAGGGALTSFSRHPVRSVMSTESLMIWARSTTC